MIIKVNPPHLQDSITADRILAYTLLRLILGLNIAIHGISRIYLGTTSFAHGLVPLFASTPLPSWLVYTFALCLPWAETLIGLMVLLGISSRSAYTLGLLLIASLTFGSALRQDWESAGLQLVYALIYAILLATRSHNQNSIDTMFAARSNPS